MADPQPPAAAADAQDWRHGGFGLYLHWPYCQAKCPYCDFNSHVARQIDQPAWARAYQAEIARAGQLTGGRVLNSIFFGGGTPSLMDPETVAAAIETARAHWPFANDIEITLEANPGSVEAGRFAAYRDAGVNRVSMGIQALNDADLRRLGRLHSVAEALAAFDVARGVFDRVSFDLIYARQGQSPADWRAELTRALGHAIDHLSLYQLTIEEGTAFGDRARAGRLRGLPAEDDAARMYLDTQEICAAHGLPAYEVSNHARPGAQSRHNLIYWRYGDYVGIGPGAHGRITRDGRRYATEAPRSPQAWLGAVTDGEAVESWTALSPEEQGEEYIMMCIRLDEGLDMDRYAALTGRPLPRDRLDMLRDLGMIELDGPRLRASLQGRPVLNAVIRELLAE